MVKLIIEDDEGKTTVVPLIRDEITIGLSGISVTPTAVAVRPRIVRASGSEMGSA